MISSRDSSGGTSLADVDRASFYRAALFTLRFVEQRRPTGRRFGVEADARWGSLRGDLTMADRMDLLLRDAYAEWPGWLGARTVFDLRVTAEDEAFGAWWSPLEPVDAEAVWHETLAQPEPCRVEDVLAGCARCWGLELSSFEAPPIGAADKLVVCGPSALAATVGAFARRTDLDWADQVTCVGTPPAHRQLAAVAGPLLRLSKAGSIVAHDQVLAHTGHCLRIVSVDADSRDAEAVGAFGKPAGP